jgi:hypothetical protein
MAVSRVTAVVLAVALVVALRPVAVGQEQQDKVSQVVLTQVHKIMSNQDFPAVALGWQVRAAHRVMVLLLAEQGCKPVLAFRPQLLPAVALVVTITERLKVLLVRSVAVAQLVQQVRQIKVAAVVVGRLATPLGLTFRLARLAVLEL